MNPELIKLAEQRRIAQQKKTTDIKIVVSDGAGKERINELIAGLNTRLYEAHIVIQVKQKENPFPKYISPRKPAETPKYTAPKKTVKKKEPPKSKKPTLASKYGDRR